MLTRRQVLGGLLASGGAGCASNSNSVYDLFSNTVRSKNPSDGGGYPLSAEQIRDIPYATMGLRIGDLAPAVVVLATVEGGDLQWVSADHVSFYTSNGRLVRTHRLARDLAVTRWLAGGDPLADFARTGTAPPRGIYYEIDLKHADEKAIAVESRFELVGEETLVILGRERLTRRIDEVATMPTWRWKTRNSYWVDAQGSRVWRSVQQYCPEIPAIRMELLKPPPA